MNDSEKIAALEKRLNIQKQILAELAKRLALAQITVEELQILVSTLPFKKYFGR